MKVKGYTRSDGVKVPSHTRKGTKSKKQYTVAQRRALEHSRTSKTGHKDWRQRQRDARKKGGSAGLWSNYWKKVKST